jgi:hypothetical protein
METGDRKRRLSVLALYLDQLEPAVTDVLGLVHHMTWPPSRGRLPYFRRVRAPSCPLSSFMCDLAPVRDDWARLEREKPTAPIWP